MDLRLFCQLGWRQVLEHLSVPQTPGLRSYRQPNHRGRHTRCGLAVSMSVQADYSSGLLELSHSTDAGRNWSPWRVIASKTNGIPERRAYRAETESAQEHNPGDAFNGSRSDLV